MKNLLLYLMLLIAVPATAQSGVFRSHPHHASRPPATHHHHESLMGHEPHHGHTPEAHAMNPKDFDMAVKIVSDESFDSKRLTIAKSIASNNKMTTNQIATLCRLFTFESSKLEFAKYAYRSCVDPNKYFMLNDVFTYSSSKEELANFVRKHSH